MAGDRRRDGGGGSCEEGWKEQRGLLRGRRGRGKGALRTHGCPHALRAHRGAAKEPDTLVQPEPSPPHRMHLSNFFLEPMTRSQPVGTQRPLTQTPPPSAEHGVPSATCGTERRRHGAAPRGGRDRRGETHPRPQHVVNAQAAGLARQFAAVLLGHAAVPRLPIGHRRQRRRNDAVVVGCALLLPERGGGWGGERDA